MRNSWKKTAAFVLALTLVAAPLTQAGKGGLFGGSAITAKAAPPSESDPGVIVAEPAKISGSDFYRMVRKAQQENNGILALEEDITLSGESTISLPDGFTLDLNGHTLDLGDDGIIKILYGSNTGDSVTIKDSSIAGTGKVTGKYELIDSNGKLTIEGGTFDGSITNYEWDDADYDISLTIKGGTFNGRIYNTKAEVFIHNGTFSTNPDPSWLVDGATVKEVEGKYVVTSAPAVVSVTGVALNKNETNLTAGSTETLTATVSPDGATDKTVTWSSSNTDVATVDANGKVTAVGAGSATIKATATNGTEDTSDDKEDYCTVIVKYPFTAESITIADFTYDGTEKTPVLKYGDTVLRYGTDYVLDEKVGDIASATDAGTYTFSASGRNDYAGENVVLTWKINKASFTLTGASLTYNGDAQNLISGDVPAGTKFTLTEPKAGLDFEAESRKIDVLMDALYDKACATSPEEREYYYSAMDVLHYYEEVLYDLKNKYESDAAETMSDVTFYARKMAQYDVEPTDDVKEAIDYINTYIKDKTLNDMKARFDTVEPDDWSDTITGTNAGTYTVYYKGSGNYDDTVKSVTASIAKADVSVTGAELTYNGNPQNLISGDVPTGTKFTLTPPQEPDYEPERTKVGQMSDALIAKGHSEGVSPDEELYYCNAGDALGAYFNAIGTLSVGNESEAEYWMSKALTCAGNMAQYDVELPDEFKEAIDYINTYIKGKTLNDLKARFVTVEPDDWSDTITATNAGDYTVYYKGSGNYDDTVKSVTAHIEWARPDVEFPTNLTAKYGQTLADVELPTAENGTWEWNFPETSVGDVGKNSFSACFKPKDSKNYMALQSVHLTVNVTAIPANPTAVGTLNATYGKTLADVALPTVEDGSGTWAWKDAATTPVGNAGEQTFKAVFTPSSTNYTAVEQDVTINVAKADPTPTDTSGLSATYGATLADVKLPTGWAWKDDTLSVGDVGKKYFGATYTPADTNNYNVIEGGVQINVIAVDKTALNEAVTAANTYLATIQKTVYADPALALISAINDAKSVAENDNVTEAQVAQAITDVNNAVTTAKAAVKEIDDTLAAQAVTDKINALPAVENIKSTDKEAIEAARAAYTDLTEAQKAKVTKAATDKLAAAEKAVADRIAADAVIEKINAIGTVALTDESKALIDAARAAYGELLTYEQKSIVSNYPTLVSAEQEYLYLLVSDVEAKINAIGDIELTDAVKAKIGTARTAYDALTADQQKLVKNAVALGYAEKLYDALDAKDKADKDKAAAEKSAAEALDKATKAETDKAAAETEAAKALDNAAKAAEAQAKAEAEAAAAKTAQANAEKAQEAAETALANAEKDAADKVAAAQAAQKTAETAQATAEKAAADAKTAQTKAEEEAAAAKTAQADAEKAQAAAEEAQKEAVKAQSAAEALAKQAEAEKEAAEKKAAEEKAAADKAAADKVIEKINEIGKVNNSNASENKIIAARAAYDMLTDDQKALVSNYDILTKSESDYDALPQTGMSGFHKVFAGLAALMGIAGFGLVKKSRKEDDDE